MIYKEILAEEHIIDSIIEESNKYVNIETGGLLFGRSIDEYIILLKVINFKNAERTKVHFEIDEGFAISVTRRMENNGLEYIGNWHKHLGYGGPSHGDDKQAEAFLIQNTHKENYLSLIIDSYGSDKYDLIPTDYYFNKEKKFTKKQIGIRRLSSIHEIDAILKDKKIDTIRFMNFLARYLEQHTGKKFTMLTRSKLGSYTLGSDMKYILSSDSVDGNNKDIAFFPLIAFPKNRLYLHDKLFVGIASKDYTFTNKLFEYKFSDLFFQKLDILPNVKNIMENPHYCSELLSSKSIEKNLKNTKIINPYKSKSKRQSVIVLIQNIVNKLLRKIRFTGVGKIR